MGLEGVRHLSEKLLADTPLSSPRSVPGICSAHTRTNSIRSSGPSMYLPPRGMRPLAHSGPAPHVQG